MVKSYLKPDFKFITLTVEEICVAGSQTCKVKGSCPDTSAPGCSFEWNGVPYYADQD